MAIFGTIFLVLFLGDLVWCWKLHLRLRRWRWRITAEACLFTFTSLQVLGLLLLFFGRGFGLHLELLLGKPLMAAIYIWHCLVLLPMAVLWFLVKVAEGFLQLWKILAGFKRQTPPAAAETKLPREVTRREFVSAALCASPAILAMGATGMAAFQWNQFRVQRINLPIARLPAALDGLTIAHVTDLHVGVFTRGPILDRIVEATNQLHADLVLLSGDLINYSLDDLPIGLDVVKRLQSTHGIFMCEGNHDLFEDPAAFREQTVKAGVRLLVNDSALIGIRGIEVQLLGLRWGAGQGDPHASSNRGDLAIAGSMKELLGQLRPKAFPILLAHHPHAFDYAENVPLTLAGHTHGGQIMLSKEIGFGPAMFRYWSGLYQKTGRALVVSNGVGNWFPLRVQAPAEIIHITLRVA